MQYSKQSNIATLRVFHQTVSSEPKITTKATIFTISCQGPNILNDYLNDNEKSISDL